MTITEKIREYLELNFDGRLMLEVDKHFYHYDNNEEILPKLVELFEKWARENEDEKCKDPVYLFDYCIEQGSYGDICSLYYENSFDDFILTI